MVIGVNSNIFPAQVASVAEIGVFSRSQADRDGVLGLGDRSACLFGIEFGGLAAPEDGDIADFAGELAGIELVRMQWGDVSTLFGFGSRHCGYYRADCSGACRSFARTRGNCIYG